MSNFQKYSMKNIFTEVAKISLFLLFFVSIQQKAQASHIVAGNLTYKHESGDNYRIKLTLRRDCFLGQVGFDTTAFIWIFTSAGESATGISNNGTLKIPLMGADTLNEFIRSDCGFEGDQVCVQEATYEALVYLPYRPGGYYFAYQRCCRNATIFNIIDPVETGSTYWTHITEDALRTRNSSPVFKNWPDVYICATKPLDFDHGAVDVDGDSLVYKLCVPSKGATIDNPKPTFPDPQPYDLVDWRPPYNLSNLLGGVPLKIDPKTGQITATPNLTGQFLVGICVEEYRKGKLIGTVRRDFQYNVRLCSQPPLAVFTTSESNCNGLTVSFFNNSLATNDFVWDFNFPSTNAAFKSTEKDPTYTFPGPGIYTVRLRATRGSDQCFDTLLQKVAVFNNNIIPAAKYSLAKCTEGSDSIGISMQDISTINEPGYTLESWVWTVTQNGISQTYSGKNPQIILKKSGLALVSVLIKGSNGCSKVQEYSIDPNELLPQSAFSITSGGCATAGQVTLVLNNESAPLNPFATITSSSWNVNGITVDGINSSVVLAQSTTNVTATLTTKFSELCEIKEEKIFSLQNIIPNAGATLQGVDCPDDANVKLGLQYIGANDLGIAKESYLWTTNVAGVTNTYATQNIEFVVPKDSLLTYSLVTKYTNGCLDTVKNALVPGPYAQIFFAADPIILCPNQQRTFVTNPNPAWTYTWSPNEGLDLTDPSNPLVKIDKNITYQVTVTDGLCTVNGTVDILALTGGVNLAIIGDTVSCDGNVALTVSGGIGNGIYQWSNDPNITNLIATGSTIQTSFVGNNQTFYAIFEGESCSTEPAKIRVSNQKPSIDDASPKTICQNDTTKLLTVNLIPSHQNTIIWNSDPRIISGEQTFTPEIGIGANESPFELYYTVTNQFGCKLVDTFRINIGQNPTVDFDFDLKACGQREFCFDIQGNYTGFLEWNFGDPNVTDDRSLEKTPCYIYKQPGTYQVVLKNLIDVCPFEEVIKTVVVNPPLAVDAGADKVICLADTLKVTATSNVADVTYEWKNASGNVLSSTKNVAVVINEPSVYVVKITDIYGCIDTDTIAARPFVFDFDIKVADSICINENTTITLDIQNPLDYTYQWSPSDVVISGANTISPTIKGVEGKEIKVIVTNIAQGCKEEATITPKVTKPFDFSIDLPQIFCKNQEVKVSLDIKNPENFDYLWTPAACFVGSNTIQMPVLNIKDDKDVTVLITNKSSGCKESKTFLAEAGDNIFVSVEALPATTIYEGEAVELYVKDPIAGSTYVWSTGQTGEKIAVKPLETTTYSVTVTDKDGCTGENEIEIVVRTAQCDESDVYLPNAFSPNDDGNNDTLIVRSNYIEEIEMIVYNRWGQEVFRTVDISVGWDGKFKNEELAADVYAYYFKVKCVNGEIYSKKGNVTLIR
jgi:gliding motility-associated-like protein